ncbi:hypothetical protein LguiA_028824 [Lonicera macranthoides]
MASVKNESIIKKEVNRGAWTDEEDQKLAQAIEIHGAKKWKTVAAKAGLNRCGKSCRLRWMNYLRPNIKRGNISDQEEDLILRLHKLLGNRWSLIARRLPGRTDNEIKNYWNSHLRKKMDDQKENIQSGASTRDDSKPKKRRVIIEKEKREVREEERSNDTAAAEENAKLSFNVDDFFDFSNEDPLTFEWVSRFQEVDDCLCELS